MNIELIIGLAVALTAFAILCGLVIYNRRIVEIIHKRDISHIREIEAELSQRVNGSDGG